MIQFILILPVLKSLKVQSNRINILRDSPTEKELVTCLAHTIFTIKVRATPYRTIAPRRFCFKHVGGRIASLDPLTPPRLSSPLG